MGGLAAAGGLLGGIVLAALATLVLRQGVLTGLKAWPRLAGVAAPLVLAAPAFAFAVFSARAGLSGAALGAATGGFTGLGLTAAVVAWAGAREKAKGAASLAAGAALAAAAVMITGFDGQIRMSEGRLMLLFAVAVILACWRSRLDLKPSPSPAALQSPWAGLLLALVGGAALVLGAGLAASEVGPLAGRRADGDLEIGLTALGVGVCLPSLVTVWLAVRRGEGGPAFVEVAAAGALGLAGGLGAAALVTPLNISETFMGWPAAGASLAAAGMVAMAAARPRPATGLRVAGGVVYAGLLAAFARSAG
jgi:cation:H+ antiporter